MILTPLRIIILLLAYCAAASGQQSTKLVWIGEHRYTVEFADTDKKRARGMMGRTELPDDIGMLFVYKKPTSVTFWMKNVPINLTAYWIDERNQVIGKTVMAPCRQRPCQRYPSPAPVLYVLELNDSEHEIKVGDKLVFSQPGL